MKRFFKLRWARENHGGGHRYDDFAPFRIYSAKPARLDRNTILSRFSQAF
jgi:hypothetical protein